MAYGRDDSGGAGITTGLEETHVGDHASRRDEEFDRRARYLAKAASLGQMVSEDEPTDWEH